MVCHICGKPATACCRHCSRYVCNEHSRSYHLNRDNQAQICTHCLQKLADEEKEREAEKRAWDEKIQIEAEAAKRRNIVIFWVIFCVIVIAVIFLKV